ncbi:GMC family oxidoreductase [Geminicoccus roseus]|uniref:GMC family oxidoreductase n=1 Tax=Geminicoccus roseus TaxID=404900 RepID=UPI00040AEFE2|nr:GMC family oxidoreductase N-terminal domain-containing protein [Geminicoccus roseus]
MPVDLGEFDYVIIGAGSAGCALANRLSADPSARVCLLEAGGQDNWIWIHIPIGYLYTQGHPRTDWCLKTEAEPGLNGRVLNYPRGKVLGGCSAINGMIYMRGQAADYDHWRQLGNPGWGWDEVLPLFKRSEDHVDGASEAHGAGGEWRVENQRLSWPILDAFREACAQVGIPPTDDFNKGDNDGCGYFQVNQKKGVRWTSAKAFLRPVKARQNLSVVTQAEARSLLFSGRRCIGVALVDGRTVRARREVISCAGAVMSPLLLQRSGIGPAPLLKELGIDVRHDLPGVGRNLQDHLQIRLVYGVRGIGTLNERVGSMLGKGRMGLEYLLFRKGPLTMAPSQLGAFTRTDPRYATPNIEYHVQPLSLDKFGDPLHPYPAFTASVCNVRPTSRGEIRLRSPDPSVPPAIAPNYLSTDEDRQVAADSIRVTRRICAAPALARYVTAELRPGPAAQDEAELVRAAGDLGTTIFHPAGSCRMGPDSDMGAVVSPTLRVHGVDGLRIADASIMPTITSGNTNSPSIMIAEKAAEMILAR